jgi:hypothetical protein
MDKTVLSNPIFIKEKYEHDKYCDGEGLIHEINRYTGEDNPRPCRLCARMRAAQLKKQAILKARLEQEAKDGGNEEYS